MNSVEWLEKFFQTDYFKDSENLFWIKKKSEEFNLDSSKANIFFRQRAVIKPNYDYVFPDGFKVLQLGIPTSIKSGVVSVMINLNKSLMKQGVSLAIINHWWHRYRFFLKSVDRFVHVKHSPFNLLTGDGRGLSIKWAFKHVAKELVEKYKFMPKIIHIHTHTFDYDNALDHSLKTYFNGVPLVYTLHAFIPYIKCSKDEKLKLLSGQMTDKELKNIQKKYYGREKSQENLIKKANCVITISQVHKEAFDMLYPQYASKCYCIPNGTDFNYYSELKKVYDYKNILQREIAPNGERIMIYVGRIEPQKGSQKLIDGFNLVASKYKDLKLVLIGSNKSELKKLLDAGLKEEFVNRIHFAGWVNDKELLAGYYKLADVLVQPVTSKNLYAMVALEAMMLKTPVITCEGKYSWGTTNSPRAILDAVDAIYTKPYLLEDHVKRVQKKVIEEHSLDAMYKKHMAVYAIASQGKN